MSPNISTINTGVVRTEKKIRLITPRTLFCAQMIVLLLIICLLAVIFAFNTQQLAATVSEHYALGTLKMISSLLVSIYKQAAYLGTSEGALTTEIMQMVDDLADRKELHMDISAFRKLLNTYSQDAIKSDLQSQYDATASLEEIADVLLEEFEYQSDHKTFGNSNFQLGILCLSEELLTIYFHNVILFDEIFPDWTSSVYQIFESVQSYNLRSHSVCESYLSLAADYNLLAVNKNGPTLSTSPVLTQQYTQSPLSLSEVWSTLLSVEQQIADVELFEEKKWQDQWKEFFIITFFSLLGLLVCLGFVLLSPFFFTKGFEVDRRINIEEFKIVERKLKILKLYFSGSLSIKENRNVNQLLEGTFLMNLVRFLRKVRPFIPQTALGDIESVNLTLMENAYNSNVTVFDNTPQHVLEDGISAQELRMEVGLSVVQGTVLFLTLNSPIPLSDEEDTEIRVPTITSRLLTFLERTVRVRQGFIHSVTHRCVIITWNVTNLCINHELESLKTALDIHQKMKSGTFSISIASSLLMAGTVREAGQRIPMICGPAMLFCQKTHQLHRYHSTAIVMDKRVAAKMLILAFPTQDPCAVPISLCKMSLDDTDYQVVYGLFHFSLSKSLGAWSTAFERFPIWMRENKLEQMLQVMEEWKRTVSLKADKSAEVAILAPIVAFWSMNLLSRASRKSEEMHS